MCVLLMFNHYMYLCFFWILVNRMFAFPEREVDFYLPQLVTMYIQMHDVAEVLHPYLLSRFVRNTKKLIKNITFPF